VDLPPIVGREAELATILGLARNARERPGPAAAVVTGDPGQGKTRLLAEVAARVERVDRLRAQGFEPERNVPLAAAGEMLRQFALLEPLTADRDGEPAATSIEPIWIFERATHAIGGLGPTLLTLDDVQWADELSVALCLYVLRAASSARQPLLVVVAGRDTPAIAAFEDAVRHVLERDAVASISLQPLDRDASLSLLRDAAPALGADGAAEVWRLAAGSPFWLHALASGSDRRALDVVATRLRGLADDAVAMLGAIAVVGRPVAAGELAGLLVWPDESARRAAASLADRGLVVDRDGGLQVVHDLLRAAAVERLRPEVRLELHRSVSEQLERTAGDDVGQLRAALEHRRLGGLPAQDLTARLLGSPRRRWLGRDGLRELAAIVDEEASGTPAWPELAVGLATLAVELNDHAYALERWRGVADRSREPSIRATAALGAAKAAFELGRAEVARDWIEIARAASTASKDPAREVALDAIDALVLIWLEHRLPEGEIIAERAAGAARALVARADGPQGLSPEAWRATLDALRVRWDAYIQRDDRVPDALTEELLALTAHDEVAHLGAILLAGLSGGAGSDLELAEERFRLVWNEARRRLVPGVVVDAGFWLAVALFDMGRLQEAEAVLAEVQALVARAGDHGKIRARSRSLPDELRIVRGDWEAAAPSLAAAARDAADAHRQIPFFQVLTKWAGRIRAGAAAEYLDAGVGAAATGGCPRCAADFHLAAAQAAARVGDGDLARRLLTAWSDERRSPNHWGVVQRRWTESLIEVGARDASEVAAELDGLAAQTDRLRLHLEATVIRLDSARILATVDRGRAAEAFREVARLASAQGAVVLERLAERELRSLGVRTWRRGAAGGGVDELTARELEVAELVARGHTNPEIAERLFLSRKTIERHVSNVLGKVGVRNRAELTAVLAARFGTEGHPATDRE
jgi:DNA-binding CsgD family transcriptional regulator